MKIDVSEVKFPSLNLNLKIYVGIPDRPGPYKVLYMHDGQNLFKDEWASYGTAWKVDSEPVKGGEGKAYLEDMVNVVMPWVEKNYPILKGPEHTAMMGASMGGVISLFAGFEYPDIFGRIGSLSGAYYVSQKAFLNYLKGPFKKVPSVFYLDVGDHEEGLSSKTTYVQVHNEIDEALNPYKPKMKYQSKIIPGGVHNERAWEQRLPDILPFLWA